MSTPAVEIASILADAGVGVFAATSGWGIFVSEEPTAPDTVVTVYDTGGFPPSAQLQEDYPTVQTRIRGAANGYTTAYLRAIAVKDALHTFVGMVDSTIRYGGILAQTEPTYIGHDDSARPLFTINFRAIRGPATSALR